MQKNIHELCAKALLQKSLTLAVAESCTGGMICARLTDIPGISAHFDRGFITYSNSAKVSMLDVNQKTLDTTGAVSLETAIEMGKGALKNSSADVALAVTGIAGPSGGTEKKPVGTVFIAVATKERVKCEEFHFSGTRHEIREQACNSAFNMLINFIA